MAVVAIDIILEERYIYIIYIHDFMYLVLIVLNNCMFFVCLFFFL